MMQASRLGGAGGVKGERTVSELAAEYGVHPTIVHQWKKAPLARTDHLKRIGARISMEGKGRCLDNIFIERPWRSLKYECVYPHTWETGSQARSGVARWIRFYNHQRPHAAHGGQPPAVVYFNKIETGHQGQRVA